MAEIRLLFGMVEPADRRELVRVLRALQAESGWVIQALDAEKVVNERHLIFAAQKALQAFSEGRNIAKDLGVEVLRYASGERQIERALSIGISEETKRVAVIMIHKNFPHKEAWPMLKLSQLIKEDGIGFSFKSERVKEAFGISEDEVWTVGEERLPDLVLERVALADTYR